MPPSQRKKPIPTTYIAATQIHPHMASGYTRAHLVLEDLLDVAKCRRVVLDS